jgi:hypothetical protein
MGDDFYFIVPAPGCERLGSGFHPKSKKGTRVFSKKTKKGDANLSQEDVCDERGLTIFSIVLVISFSARFEAASTFTC